MNKRTRFAVLTLVGVLVLGICRADNPKGVTLYTPFTQISVPPGETIDYSVEIINKNENVEDLDVSVSGMPRGWNYELKSGGWKIGRISVLPDERKTLSLRVEVPVQVNKGSYSFSVNAGSI